MKITCVMVMSADGKTTKWNEPDIHRWTSKEDQRHFSSITKKDGVFIMGRKTFDAARKIMKLSPNILRVVMTKNPARYADMAVSNQLEFTTSGPKKLTEALAARGFKNAFLFGGEHTNTAFFREKLVHEAWLTIEPKIFGTGNNLVSEEKLNIDLQLKSIKKLNKKGTLLLKYAVRYL